MNLHFKRVTKLGMAGLSLTVCGTVLLFNQLNAQADTPQQSALSNEEDNNAATTTPSTPENNDQQQVTLRSVQANTKMAVADANQYNVNTVSTTNSDQGNYGSLDQATITNGQLDVSGWNANGQADGRPYHTIIVVDHNTGQELGRQQVQPQSRPDVAQAYPNVAGAGNAGWKASFKINSTNWTSHSIQIVSRYSNDVSANNTDAYYWYAPVTFDQRNEGSLDQWSFADGHLTARGWNATNASYQDPSHWIIVYDRTQGRELYRQKVTTSARPDVGKAYNIYNANHSGWTFEYNFGNDHRWLNDQLQIISRYSDDAQNGEGHHVDYWYSPIQSDRTNRANLDTASIANGKLTLAGWHATDGSQGRDHHFIIILNSNGRELTRQEVTNTARLDVARAFESIYDADKAGWQTTLNLQPQMVEGSIRVISRYSSSSDGNSDYVDYWFNPVTFNTNYAGISTIKNDHGQLKISGYHAADAAYGEQNHFLILYDLTANRQVASVKTSSAVTPAIAKGLSAYNAEQSGFSAVVQAPNGIDSNHQYALVLRYSASNTGNGGNGPHTDAWLSLSRTNHGYLDSFNLSNGNLTVSGWNANDFAVVAPYHYLIVFDNTTGQQVASQLVNNSQERDDVAKAYPHMVTANQSGFSANFGHLNLQPGHSYSVVSRYSTSNQGNGGNGAAQDLWLGPVTLNQSAYAIDSITQNSKSLQVTGWMASDQHLIHPYAYVIAMYNGSEIGRSRVAFTNRPDVARVYPQVYASGQSGFNVNIPINAQQLKDGQLSFILRFASDPAGNANYSDMRSRNYQTNLGDIQASYDETAKQIKVNGWHAAMGKTSRPYEYLIVVGMDGHEFYRRQLNNGNDDLTNLAGSQNAPWIIDAGHAGFTSSLPVNSNMNHWGVRIIHRYTNDPNGNGDAIDIYSPEISINSGFQHLNGGTVYYDPDRGQLATGWRTINGNRYYFSDGYQHHPYPINRLVMNNQLRGQMYTGVNWVDGHCYDFGNDGIARAQPQNDWWSWPFSQDGEGYFSIGQRFGATGAAGRRNGYHDGLDFGSYDHPGSAVHAVHGGKVLTVDGVRDSHGNVQWWYVLVYDGRYLYVYQEAFSNPSRITVHADQIIYPGQVIGYRDTSHLHLGINTSPNYGPDLAHSYQESWSDPSEVTGGGTWLNPEIILRNNVR